MSASQLLATCWVPGWAGDDRTAAAASAGPHYATADKLPAYEDGTGRASFHVGCGGVVIFGISGGFCIACEAEGLDDADWEARVVVPRGLAGCWIVTCDGACGDVLEDDEAGTLHASSRAEAERSAAVAHSWRFTRDGRAFCQDDAPECADAGLQVIVQMPGQLAFCGNDASGA